MTNYLYTAPIIPADLCRTECIHQFADTFEYVDATSQDMFNRITSRLNIYRAQLNKLDERIHHFNAHLDRIKGCKRAIQIHSSARYPVKKNRSTYQSVFEYDRENEEHQPPVLHYNPLHLNKTVDRFIDQNDDTLIIMKQFEENCIENSKSNFFPGQRKPPRNIKSVVSFLTYNTQENPHTRATKIDPFGIGCRVRKQADKPIQPGIAETILPDSYSRKVEKRLLNDYHYAPPLGCVPEFSLPDNLPDLDYFTGFGNNTVADRTQKQMTPIAPSYIRSILPELNDLTGTLSTNVVEPIAEPAITLRPPSVILPNIIPLDQFPLLVTPPFVPSPPPPPAPPTLPPPTPEIPSVSAPSPPVAKHQDMLQVLKQALAIRRGFYIGEKIDSSKSLSEFTIDAKPTISTPQTGDSFMDAIALKAKEFAEEQKQRRKEDNSDDDDE